MTEPGTGSDLQGIKTRAVKQGDHYVLDESKTFISNGVNSDLGDRGGADRPLTKERKAFSRFLLAEPATETTVVRVMVDGFIAVGLSTSGSAVASWS